ncbi:GerMN domain-containing protein [Tessaracoccus flavus]|uniref:Uncharacterized protein n=1 Tax=Tessaracoccus flavus TaxID=1610493 RepID=A0A1Q2CC57_9ACTN|nr:GerMN domain-containing protein [Tessaracoccus flavus]AQP43686.1 hypothetical protein RPIT_01730 [Tessaracoccus flavus]SDZ02716.1 DNA-directed RNA polymerase specialized sigma subunit, sigma24 family [Tessaracoccus flavus]
MAGEEERDWLLQLHEEHGAMLHRLAVLLGAADESERIVRSAFLALYRRGRRVIDPADRVEFLHEHVVHLARAVRGSQGSIELGSVPDSRQDEILRSIGESPDRAAELLVVSHYLGVFGPELAGIMRMSVRSCNQKLEQSLEAVRDRVGDPTPGILPGVIESLSQEVTDALRSAARQVPTPEADTLAKDVAELDSARNGLGPRIIGVLTLGAIAAGLLLAAVTRPTVAAPELPAVSRQALPPSPVATRSLPALVRDVPLYFIGQDGKLYREQRNLPASDNLLSSALDALLTLVPRDPDYASAWSGGQVHSAELAGETLTVDLSADAYEGFTSPALAQQARDQAVYTASELIGNPNLRVVFLSDAGAPPADFAAAEGYTRRGLDPMPAVWITNPRNGEQSAPGAHVFVGTVKADVGEPIVTITEIASGRVIAEVSAQTSLSVNSDGWRVWSVSINLDPGSYDIKAAVTTGTPPVTVSENKSIRIG